MDPRRGSILSVSIRWDLFLTVIVITVTCGSALEWCPYKRCSNCVIEYLTCKVKCCQSAFYIFCCGEDQNSREENTQLARPSSFPVSIVVGTGAAIILIILFKCILCVIHTKKKKARRINIRSGASTDVQRRHRNGQEPTTPQYSFEMSTIRKSPPYIQSPPPYCQAVSNINIYDDNPDYAQLAGTAEEINRLHSTLPPPYSETTGTLTAPRDTTLQRY